jgi:hypothetical protein
MIVSVYKFVVEKYECRSLREVGVRNFAARNEPLLVTWPGLHLVWLKTGGRKEEKVSTKRISIFSLKFVALTDVGRPRWRWGRVFQPPDPRSVGHLELRPERRVLSCMTVEWSRQQVDWSTKNPKQTWISPDRNGPGKKCGRRWPSRWALLSEAHSWGPWNPETVRPPLASPAKRTGMTTTISTTAPSRR